MVDAKGRLYTLYGAAFGAALAATVASLVLVRVVRPAQPDLSTHNAGIEGSSPSLSTNKNNKVNGPATGMAAVCRGRSGESRFKQPP